MTRTVTYDETQWKLMPIEPTEEMIGADIEPLYGMDMALAYKTMLNYAPPYPESNFVESLDSSMPVGFLDHGGVFYAYKYMPKDTTELYIKPAPKEQE